MLSAGQADDRFWRKTGTPHNYDGFTLSLAYMQEKTEKKDGIRALNITGTVNRSGYLCVALFEKIRNTQKSLCSALFSRAVAYPAHKTIRFSS